MFAATQRSSFFAVPPTSRLRWLVSLRWLDASETAGSPDQVPLFPLPAPRYYPSGQLFR